MVTSKKTIIYIGGFELPDKNAAAQRVIANGKLFRELGYNVVFLGVDRLGNDSGVPMELTKSMHFGFECWSIPKPNTKLQWLKYLASIGSLTSLIESHYKSNVAMIVCYNYPAVGLWQVRRLCRRIGAKYVPDVTEWYASAGKGLLYVLIKWLDTALRMHIMHRLSDGMITTSALITKFYQSRNRFPIVELPTLFDKELIIRAESTNSSAKPVWQFIYVGNPFSADMVGKQRNNIKDRLDIVIKLISALNASGIISKLSIYGLEAETYLTVYPEHHELIYCKSQCILFHGYQPHSVVLQAIQASDFSIFFRDATRVTESGFPTKLSESITYGTPVITNYLRNLEKYVEVEGLYLLDVKDLDLALHDLSRILSTIAGNMFLIKQSCRKQSPFDYRNYKLDVRHFMMQLSVQLECSDIQNQVIKS